MDNLTLSTPVQITSQSQAPVILAPPQSWEDLAKIEPRLLDVESFVRHLPKRRWANWEQVKARFTPLVGWHSRNSLLRASSAYHLAYDHLLAIFEGGER